MIARLIISGVMDNPSFVTEKQNQACEIVPMIKVGNHPLRHPGTHSLRHSGICAANFRGPATKEKGIARYHPSIFIHESTIIIRGRFSHHPQPYHRIMPGSLEFAMRQTSHHLHHYGQSE
jgi:hypothetical protein